MRRRDYLRTSALAASLSAGCLGHLDSTVTLPESATLTGWPMYGANPAHTGSVTDDPPALSEPTRRWEHATPGHPATPPAIGGDIITVGMRGGEVRAIERSSGELVWDAELDHRISGQPVVQDGTVYVGSVSSEFVALDARTGDEQWRYEFGTANRATGGFEVDTPAVLGETVFVTIDGVGDPIHAASVADGSRRWSVDAMDRPGNPVPHGEELYVGGAALALDSGESVRQYVADPRSETLTPAVSDASVFLVRPQRLARYPARDVDPTWDVEVPAGKRDVPVFADGRAFLSGIAFDAGDGTQLFEVPTDARTSPAVTGSLGLVARRESLVAFDPTDGTVRWESDIVERWRPKQPAIGEDGAFVATGDGVVAFE